MANLISLESLKSIKALCDTLNITSSPGLKKRNHCSQRLSEILKKPATKPVTSFNEDFKLWLKSLDPLSLHSFLCHSDSFISSVLLQMFLHKYTNGNFEFSLQSKSDKKNLEVCLKDLFSLKKVSTHTSICFKESETLERALRFADIEEYCDSLALELGFVRNQAEFFEIFDAVTKGRCFKTPCRAYWDNTNKRWVFEFPSWFEPQGFNSLASWACASFERNLWQHFFIATKLDPRVEGESKDFSAKSTEFPDVLITLTPTFCSIKHTQKVLEFSSNLKDIFSEVSSKLKSSNVDFHGPPSSEMYRAKDSCLNYQSCRSLELIENRLKGNDEDLVEFLFFSPINRAGTVLDVVCRILGVRIKDIHNHQLAESLIVTETTNEEVKVKIPKKNKPNKKYHMRNDVNREYLEASKYYSRIIVENSLSRLYRSLAEEPQQPSDKSSETDFQVVQRKNKRPQPQQKSTNCSIEYSKPKLSQRGKNSGKKKQLNSSARPKKSNFLWERSNNPPVLASNEAEFPPLSAASNIRISDDSLHQEIYKYGIMTIRKVQEKTKYIYMILGKINEVVSEQLGGYIALYGSYATGLAIESSDIDIAIKGVDLHSRQLVQTACMQLSGALKLLPFVVTCNAIITAKVPVIKLHTDLQIFSGNASTEMIDITFVENFEGTHLGIEAISFTKDLLILFPHIRYLALVLKNFLYSNNLNSAYHGKE